MLKKILKLFCLQKKKKTFNDLSIKSIKNRIRWKRLKCIDCDKNGQTYSFDGKNFQSKIITCPRCKGIKKLSFEELNKIVNGKIAKQDRLQQHLTIHEMSLRTGKNYAEISRVESGF